MPCSGCSALHRGNPNFKKIEKSKHKNIFAEAYVKNWSEEVFMIKKIKNTVP